MPVLPGGGQGFAIDQPADLGDPRTDAAGEVALLESGCDGLGDDALGQRVGNGTLEATAHFDPQFAIVLGNQQQYAVIDLLAAGLRAAEFPGLDHFQAEFLDGLRLGRGHDQHGHLRALALLDGRQLSLDLCPLLGAERTGGVGDPCDQLGDGLFVLRPSRTRAQGQPERQQNQPQRTGR